MPILALARALNSWSRDSFLERSYSRVSDGGRRGPNRCRERKLRQRHGGGISERDSSPSIETTASWAAASAVLFVFTFSYGAPLLVAVALKPIAADLGSARSVPALANSLAWLGSGAGALVRLDCRPHWCAPNRCLWGRDDGRRSRAVVERRSVATAGRARAVDGGPRWRSDQCSSRHLHQPLVRSSSRLSGGVDLVSGSTSPARCGRHASRSASAIWAGNPPCRCSAL